MAITKIHPITTTLTKALNYIQNPKKTDGTLLVDGYGCVPETAYQQFMRTKEKVDKKDGWGQCSSYTHSNRHRHSGYY